MSIGFGGPAVGFISPGGGAGGLPLTGGTMAGDIDMGGHSVTNVRLVVLATGVSTTTAALGLADIYRATAAPITITISTSDIVEGRPFKFQAGTPNATGGSPVTIDTEGAELIDGESSITLTFENDFATLVVVGGNLVSP